MFLQKLWGESVQILCCTEAYLTRSATCARSGVDTTGAVRFASTFHHTNLLPGGVRRLGDILGAKFGRLRREHDRAALLAFGLSSPINIRRAKVRCGWGLCPFQGDKSAAHCVHSGQTWFFFFFHSAETWGDQRLSDGGNPQITTQPSTL